MVGAPGYPSLTMAGLTYTVLPITGLNQATTQTVLILFRRIVDALSVGVFLIMVAASPVFLIWHAMREIWWLLPLDGFGVILLVWLFWRFANRNAKPC
jgi:hypothetical protein